MSRDERDDDEEFLWLRESIEDDDLIPLFSDRPEHLRSAVRRLLVRAQDDAALESRLIETLETAVEESCDDTQASMWMAVILGEIQSERALPVLLRCLMYEEDEALQEVAEIALLRVGRPALTMLMEWVEEDQGVTFRRTAYHLLGRAGVLEDEELKHEISDFVDLRLGAERRQPPQESALEDLAEACARLGLREHLPALREIVSKDFVGNNPALQDAVEYLQENEAGVAFVPTILPWMERYGWLFEDELESARASRGDRGALSSDEEEELARDREDLSNLYWGLSATADLDATGEERLDARRYLRKPADEE